MDQNIIEKKLFSMYVKPKTQGICKIDQRILDKLIEKEILEELPKEKPTHKSKYKLTERGQKIIKENKEILANILKKFDSIDTSKIMKKEKPKSSSFSSKTISKNYNSAINQFTPYMEDIKSRLRNIEEIMGPVKIIIDQMNIIKIIDSLIITEMELLHKNNPGEPVFPLSKIMFNLEAKGASKSLLDQRFLELEKRRIITLQAANDPRRLENKRYGIFIPHRGLLYYCSMN